MGSEKRHLLETLFGGMHLHAHLVRSDTVYREARQEIDRLRSDLDTARNRLRELVETVEGMGAATLSQVPGLLDVVYDAREEAGRGNT